MDYKRWLKQELKLIQIIWIDLIYVKCELKTLAKKYKEILDQTPAVYAKGCLVYFSNTMHYIYVLIKYGFSY